MNSGAETSVSALEIPLTESSSTTAKIATKYAKNLNISFLCACFLPSLEQSLRVHYAKCFKKNNKRIKECSSGYAFVSIDFRLRIGCGIIPCKTCN